MQYVRMTLNQLDDNTNLGQLLSVDKQIDDILLIDLSSLVQEGYKSFNDVPERLQTQTVYMVSVIKDTLNSISSNIKTINEQISIHDKL